MKRYIRVVRKLQFLNNFRLKITIFRALALKIARLVRQLLTQAAYALAYEACELSNKSIIIFLFVVTVFSCASAKVQSSIGYDKKINSLNHITNGEYAFYLDKRFSDTFYRGYLKFSSEDNTSIIFVRNINLDSNNEERFMFTVKDDKKGFPTIIDNIQGQFLNVLTRQAIPDFINFISFYIRTKNTYDIQKNIIYDWDETKFSFNKVLPFFSFYEINNGNDSLYKLEYSGIINSNDVAQFFELAPIKPKTPFERQIPIIPNKNTLEKEMNNINITLDENWIFNDNKMLPGYWLSLSSIRDSQIAIEKCKLKQFNLNPDNYYLIFKYLILNAKDNIEMNTVNITKKHLGYQIEYYLWENNRYNYQRAILFLIDDDIIIINFSSFADIYNNNKEYYEKIFESIKIQKQN